MRTPRSDPSTSSIAISMMRIAPAAPAGQERQPEAVLSLEGAKNRTSSGRAVDPVASARDDGIPLPAPWPMLGSAVRAAPSSWAAFQHLACAWRGSCTRRRQVTFDPDAVSDLQDTRPQSNSRGRLGGRHRSFRGWQARCESGLSEPGTYVLRCLAHDASRGQRGRDGYRFRALRKQGRSPEARPVDAARHPDRERQE